MKLYPTESRNEITLGRRSMPPSDGAVILVAEDDPELRRIIVDALCSDGHHVLEVADGAQLFARLKAEHEQGTGLELVVSDVRMPAGNGLMILEDMREKLPKLPVIFMTAFSDQETRAQASSLGAYVFDKPFDIDDLRTAVVNVLGDRAPR